MTYQEKFDTPELRAWAETIDRTNLPAHIAIIMDGNGRWAKKRSLGRIAGHRKGVDAVRNVVKACRKLEIPYLTLYAFSMENWNRPKEEVSALMGLLKHFIKKELEDLRSNGIRLKVIGRMELLPQDVRELVQEAIDKTSHNTDMNLIIALSYGSRDEIVHAARRFAKDALEGRVNPDDLDEARFSEYLYTSGIPDPDLLIRTSGEMRISNFLLWQLAYTEIYITDALWPDFDKEELAKAIKSYQGRERRFGLTAEQIAEGRTYNPGGVG